MPFTIIVHGMGTTHSFEDSRTLVAGGYVDHNTDYGIQASTDDLMIEIDTNADNVGYDTDMYSYSIQYSLRGEVLRFSKGISPKSASAFPEYLFTSVTIVFTSGEDSILSLRYSEVDSFYDAQMAEYVGIKNNSFRISSLAFNDTSIFAIDSSFSDHNIAMTSDSVNGDNEGQYNFDYKYSDFTASSVTLSGIFRPTTFSEPAIVTEAPHPNNLAIYSSNGSIACSFDVSDHARDLEIFSPLGIREPSSTISAGQTAASLPHLPAGFYFVRLEGSMAKIYTAE